MSFCLHRLIEMQVERTPNGMAVVFENESLTYGKLNRRANQLAHRLRKLGVGPDAIVGIFAERSLEMVVGLLATLKAGGAYLPLEPTYPAERLAFMLGEAQPSVVLVQSRLAPRLPRHAGEVIFFEDNLAAESGVNPDSGTQLENLAYVIYTSGSTGLPKGVMNTHRGICNRLLWMQETYQLTVGDRVLQKTPFTFDVSVWEFFWPLFTGAQLVVARPGLHGDSQYLVRVICEKGITTLHFVPSMLAAFLEDRHAACCLSLRQVFCSGETLHIELQKRFFATLSETQLHNLYGPTEAAIDVTFWKCKRGSDEPIVPIGWPIANTQIYILDEAMQPVPIGVRGNSTSAVFSLRADTSVDPSSPPKNSYRIHPAKGDFIKRATSHAIDPTARLNSWVGWITRLRSEAFASSWAKSKRAFVSTLRLPPPWSRWPRIPRATNSWWLMWCRRLHPAPNSWSTAMPNG